MGDFCPGRHSHEYAAAADLTPDAKSARITPLPALTTELLRGRHEVLREFTTLLFPMPLMRLRDPSNTQRDSRPARRAWLSRTFYAFVSQDRVEDPGQKKGLSATEIADYRGHENPSMTQDIHMNTIKGSKRAAEVMGQRLDGLI